MVAARGDLPHLSPLLDGQRWRRGRRPARHPGPARPSHLAWGGRGLDLAGVPVARRRPRLRRGRLHRDRPPVRDHGGHGPADRGRARARAAGAAGLGPQPHLRPAPLVPGVALGPRRPQARLVCLARPGPGRRPADQLGRVRGPERLVLGRGDRPVLLPFLPRRPARHQLAQPPGPVGHAGDAAVLAGARGGRVPDRRALAAGRGRPARPGCRGCRWGIRP